MSEIQVCEGIWRTRCGQRVVVTQCEPVDGQRWTDGVRRYSDDGRYYLSDRGAGEDLVEFVRPLPESSQRAPVSRPAETESTTAVAGGVSEDPGRIIYQLEQRLEAAKERNSKALGRLSDANAEIERLKAELKIVERGRDLANADADHLRTEFTAAQQLRAENESLTVRLQRAEVAAAEALQRWETTSRCACELSQHLRGCDRDTPKPTANPAAPALSGVIPVHRTTHEERVHRAAAVHRTADVSAGSAGPGSTRQPDRAAG